MNIKSSVKSEAEWSHMKITWKNSFHEVVRMSVFIFLVGVLGIILDLIKNKILPILMANRRIIQVIVSWVLESPVHDFMHSMKWYLCYNSFLRTEEGKGLTILSLYYTLKLGFILPFCRYLWAPDHILYPWLLMSCYILTKYPQGSHCLSEKWGNAEY